MPVDPLRHLSVFDPQRWGDKRIDVIGAGATGSRIALSLAKLGVQNLHVWDDDVIEEHNIANQVFGVDEVGELKAVALAGHIGRLAELALCARTEKVTGETDGLGSVVFLLTDTMESRRDIFEGALRMKMGVELVVETRMGADTGRIYTFDPRKPRHVEAWLATLYDDDIAEDSACGARATVGATAELVSGMAVWQFMNWFAGGELDHELIFATRPFVIIGNRWK